MFIDVKKFKTENSVEFLTMNSQLIIQISSLTIPILPEGRHLPEKQLLLLWELYV